MGRMQEKARAPLPDVTGKKEISTRSEWEHIQFPENAIQRVHEERGQGG